MKGLPELKAMAPAVVLAAVLSFFGCATTSSREGAVEHPKPELAAADVPKEIARLKDTAAKHTDAAERAEARRDLALIYVSPVNPKPDYSLALKELEQYESAAKALGIKVREEARELLNLLREIRRLGEEVRQQRQRNDELLKENAELKESIEKLKQIDIHMEQKRRQSK